eukprot:CAMPEP_0195516652 /NCGR_PEP_ID=MMETSP0794_2-20130614/8197_1 /TAXON_ID=515487 /ORGANISM="Stephanopyxis turris, Strain CCMP 815" /LENGTH=125 /DNA_ID=CAMNT_0040645299 /DNA_START=63 /DNA_END=440 /DNA_ORIENTATION=+
MVREVASKEEFDKILSEAGDKLVIVEFTATWCGPCKAIAPKFQSLSEEHKDLIFLKVDVDKCRDLSTAHNISAMPTFKFFKGGELYHSFQGASVANIKAAIKTYSPSDATPNPNPEAGGGGCVVL